MIIASAGSNYSKKLYAILHILMEIKILFSELILIKTGSEAFLLVISFGYILLNSLKQIRIVLFSRIPRIISLAMVKLVDK